MSGEEKAQPGPCKPGEEWGAIPHKMGVQADRPVTVPRHPSSAPPPGIGLKLSFAPLCCIWKADVLPPWGLWLPLHPLPVPKFQWLSAPHQALQTADILHRPCGQLWAVITGLAPWRQIT